jgi:hypothetical protein
MLREGVMLKAAIHRTVTLLVLAFALIASPKEFLTNDLVRIAVVIIVGDLLYSAYEMFKKFKRRRRRKMMHAT